VKSVEKENVLIVSLGQLVASDESASVKAFAKIPAIRSKVPGSSWLPEFIVDKAAGAIVKLALYKDSIIDKTIYTYKTQNPPMDWDTFYTRIVGQLGVTKQDLPEADFKNAWNAMCVPSTEIIEQLKELAQIQKETGLKIVVPSATNKEQFEFIQSVFKKEGIKFDVSKTFYVLSYEEKTMDNTVLANKGIAEVCKNTGKTMDDLNILSVHGGIIIGKAMRTDPPGQSIASRVYENFPEIKKVKVAQVAVSSGVVTPSPVLDGPVLKGVLERRASQENLIS
jgi:hypothetical protein